MLVHISSSFCLRLSYRCLYVTITIRAHALQENRLAEMIEAKKAYERSVAAVKELLSAGIITQAEADRVCMCVCVSLECAPERSCGYMGAYPPPAHAQDFTRCMGSHAQGPMLTCLFAFHLVFCGCDVHLSVPFLSPISHLAQEMALANDTLAKIKAGNIKDMYGRGKMGESGKV